MQLNDSELLMKIVGRNIYNILNVSTFEVSRRKTSAPVKTAL